MLYRDTNATFVDGSSARPSASRNPPFFGTIATGRVAPPYAGATFWYVLPSLPMFLAIPAMLNRGVPFWLALGSGCLLTILLYLGMTWLGPRFGFRL